jgi:electron transport complex protein RnfD
MAVAAPPVQIRTSPHIRRALAVDVIMRNVVYALVPVCAYAVYLFGLSAAALLAVCVIVCVLTEALSCRLSGRASTVGDWSAVITGALLALTLPPGFPLWMAAVAGFVAIALGKALFGGLGYNVMNPALVGRAFVQAAFPSAITSWTPPLLAGRFGELIPTSATVPFLQPPALDTWLAGAGADGFTGATPLALMKFQHLGTEGWDLLIGTTSGSMGETGALLILVCGAYLAARGMMDWRIPVAVVLAALLLSGAFHLVDPARYPSPLFTLFSGGLMLGAVFMASDMVGSPVTPLGVWIYGALIGGVTVVIRLFGGLTEGVMYAILLGNALSPLIESVTQPRVYGARRQERRS